MSSYELTGKLTEVFDQWSNEAGTFKKREFVIYEENERNTQYSDYHKFQLVQDKCDLIDKYQIGDILTISFNLNGKKWEKDGKVSYFASLQAWKIHKEEGNAAIPDMPQMPPEEEDPLPF